MKIELNVGKNIYLIKKIETSIFNKLVTNDCVIFNALLSLNKKIDEFSDEFKYCFSLIYEDEDEEGNPEQVEEILIAENSEWEYIECCDVSIKPETLELLTDIKMKLIDINKKEYDYLDFELTNNMFVDNEIIKMAVENMINIQSRWMSYEELVNKPDDKFDEIIVKKCFSGNDKLFDDIAEAIFCY